MKTLAKRIGIGLGVLILGFLAFVATRPDTFHLERSTEVSASPEEVFPLINDFHNWTRWSPWEKLDPNLKRTYAGPPQGPGASYSWIGNDQVGEGRMTVTDSKPGEHVSIKLEFLKPFAATNQTEFTLAPSENGTRVTWAMDGKNDFMSKAMQVFMDMDAMVGKDFEVGLANLNEAAKATGRGAKAKS